MKKTLVNGKPQDTIKTNDRGLLYGDGLFETMAVRNGKITFWEDHWQRLALGCGRLSISLPNKDLIEKEIKQFCNNESETQFIIKLIVTRGEGERGYRFSNKQNVTRILSIHHWPSYPEHYQENGVAVRYCETTLSENIKLAGIKHLNRLEQVLARNEWGDEFQEGLMSTIQGHVVDGTMSNIFSVKNKKLCTPRLSLSGVSGVMRKTVIGIAKELGFQTHEKKITKEELESADELFLTNSIFGVWPVRLISTAQFTKVGSMTRQIQKALKNRLV